MNTSKRLGVLAICVATLAAIILNVGIGQYTKYISIFLGIVSIIVGIVAVSKSNGNKLYLYIILALFIILFCYQFFV